MTTSTGTTASTAADWSAGRPRSGAPRRHYRGAGDTFHFTNAAPQADVFNQGRQIWEGLENHLLDHADAHDRRLAVLTGPVLHDSDPPYRGIQVPMRFWKVAAFLQDGALAAAAYVLDQSPDLSRDAERALAGATPGAPPPLGPFRAYQVPVSDVAEITELEFGALPDVDVMPTRSPEERWRRLESYEDIVLHPEARAHRHGVPEARPRRALSRPLRPSSTAIAAPSGR